MASVNYVPTTVLLEPDLLADLKLRAASTKQSLSSLIRKQLAKLTTKRTIVDPKTDGILKHFSTLSSEPLKGIDIDNIRDHIDWTRE